MSDGDPQSAIDRRLCARQLVQHPLTCAEHDPELFRLLRRHESELDRWFTQRLGYRLHLDADTARLFKVGVVPTNRPLRTRTERAFRPDEYTLLALVLASTAAGPAIISLRDLVAEVRSAAAEADIALVGDSSERRAIVGVLRWMIDHGLASELHEHIDAYVADDDADAVLKLRPDRIALLPIPALIGADEPATLLDRAERRSNTRQWMRCRLLEDPVLYRDDLTDIEWGELRRRLGEEERTLDEMFGLVLESRAEGVAAIDPAGTLADRRFPTTGTVGHAALLLIERLSQADADPAASFSAADILDHVTVLVEAYGPRWSKDLVSSPERLTRQVIGLLEELRLLSSTNDAPEPEVVAAWEEDAVDAGSVKGARSYRLLPAAARFLAIEVEPAAGATEQGAMW